MRCSGRNAPFIRLAMWRPIQNDATARNQSSPDETTRKKTSFYHLLCTANWIEFRHVSDALPCKSIALSGQATLKVSIFSKVKYANILTGFLIRWPDEKPIFLTSTGNPIVPLLFLGHARLFPGIGARSRRGHESIISFAVRRTFQKDAPISAASGN